LSQSKLYTTFFSFKSKYFFAKKPATAAAICEWG
jgi:hypothetical protein